MAIKLKRKPLTYIALLVVIIGCVFYYQYNRGPLDVKNSKGILVKATELYTLFSSDSLNAAKKYTGKVLAVNGEVTAVSLNNKQQKVVLLKTGMPQGYINCTLEEMDEKNIKLYDNINIKGICNGIGQGDPDMGIMGDVYLTRSFLQK